MYLQNLMTSLVDLVSQFAQNLHNNIGIWYFALYNFFGLISVVVKFIEYQLRSRNTTIILSTVAMSSWVFYFGLKGDIASAVSTLISATSCLIFLQRYRFKWARSPFWLFFFIGISIFNLIINFANWYDAFCILATIFGTLAYFVRDIKKYKHFALLNETCWLLNSIFKLHIVCLVCDVLGFTSVIISVATTYWFRKRKDKAKDKEITQQNS